MIPVLTAEQSRRQDAMATADPRTLLDRAGLAVALQAVAMGAGYGSRVAVLAGPGNNGGDGYVAARYLAGRGIAVDVYPLAEPRTDPAIWARDLARREGVRVRSWPDARPADMVIDALFGAGFRGEPPDLSAWTRPDPGEAAGVPWLAVDVPSGLDATTGEAAEGTPCARATVTFHGYRVGHLVGSGPDLCGDVVVADIGLPDVAPELWLCEEADALASRAFSHRAQVVGGFGAGSGRLGRSGRGRHPDRPVGATGRRRSSDDRLSPHGRGEGPGTRDHDPGDRIGLLAVGGRPSPGAGTRPALRHRDHRTRPRIVSRPQILRHRAPSGLAGAGGGRRRRPERAWRSGRTGASGRHRHHPAHGRVPTVDRTGGHLPGGGPIGRGHGSHRAAEGRSNVRHGRENGGWSTRAVPSSPPSARAMCWRA